MMKTAKLESSLPSSRHKTLNLKSQTAKSLKKFENHRNTPFILFAPKAQTLLNLRGCVETSLL